MNRLLGRKPGQIGEAVRHKLDPVPISETKYLKETVYILTLAFSQPNHPKLAPLPLFKVTEILVGKGW